MAYVRAKDILTKNKHLLKQLAEKLLEKEVIFKEDLEIIFGKRPFDTEEQLLIKANGKPILDDNEPKLQVVSEDNKPTVTEDRPSVSEEKPQVKEDKKEDKPKTDKGPEQPVNTLF